MTPRPSPKKSSQAELDFGRFAGLGLRFVLTIALFGLLGWWLDGKVGSTPWILVSGVVLGAVVAFISIVRAVPPARNLHLPPLPDDDSDSDRENDRDR
jgi:F0F1-type ATP synthase assembly protein I